MPVLKLKTSPDHAGEIGIATKTSLQSRLELEVNADLLQDIFEFYSLRT